MPFPTIAANLRKRPSPQLHGFKGSERRLHFWIGASETTRELADDALEELLEHPHISEFVENRLFSKCLPEDALWRGEGTFGGSQYNEAGIPKALRGGGPRGHRERAVGV